MRIKSTIVGTEATTKRNEQSPEARAGSLTATQIRRGGYFLIVLNALLALLPLLRSFVPESPPAAVTIIA